MKEKGGVIGDQRNHVGNRGNRDQGDIYENYEGFLRDSSFLEFILPRFILRLFRIIPW